MNFQTKEFNIFLVLADRKFSYGDKSCYRQLAVTQAYIKT